MHWHSMKLNGNLGGTSYYKPTVIKPKHSHSSQPLDCITKLHHRWLLQLIKLLCTQLHRHTYQQ